MNKDIYKHLPTVNYDVIKKALSSSRPLTMIRDFVSGIQNASNETKLLIIEQYVDEINSYYMGAQSEPIIATQNVSDNIVPKAISDSSDSLGGSLEDKLMGSQPSNRRKFITVIVGSKYPQGIGMFYNRHEPHIPFILDTECNPKKYAPAMGQIPLILGTPSPGKTFFPSELQDSNEIQFEMDPQTVSDRFNTAFDFVEKQRNANRICVVTSGDSELEAKILGSIPNVMQCDVDIIHLKGNELEREEIARVIEGYGTVIIEDIHSYIKADCDISSKGFEQRIKHLAMVIQGEQSFPEVKAYSIEDIKYDPKFHENSSPIFNPKHHGRKKGGYKGGFKRGKHGYKPRFRRY